MGLLLLGIVGAILHYQEHKTVAYEIEILINENHTYGYVIYQGDKKMIYQPFIPSFPGIEGFQSSAEAHKVAQWVVQKLESGKSPILDRYELQKLGIKIKS